MKFTVTSTTTPDCIEYLLIIKDGKEYSIEDFAKEFYKGEFSLDILMHDCVISYRGQNYTWDEIAKRNFDFHEALLFSKRYNALLARESLMFFTNYDYYKAMEYIYRAESCLQTGRYYLGLSSILLPYSEEIHWSTGYGPIFMIRTVNCSTATIWYNHCFDYILLILFFAFGLYKEVPDYAEGMSHEALLKICSYDSVCRVYSRHKGNTAFKALWEIISRCYAALTTVNSWTNYIKHKGGVGYIGLRAEDPIGMVLTDLDGTPIRTNSHFESVILDLDDAIQELAKAHAALHRCCTEVIDFLNFDGAQEIFVDGKKVITPPAYYVPDILK